MSDADWPELWTQEDEWMNEHASFCPLTSLLFATLKNLHGKECERKRAFHRLYAHDGVGRFSYLQVSNVGFAEMWPMKCARKNWQGSFFFFFFFLFFFFFFFFFFILLFFFFFF